MTQTMQSMWITNKTELPNEFRAWMEDEGSFMQRLVQYQVNDAHINVLQQQWLHPTTEEKRLLAFEDDKDVWVREVLIESAGKQWMFARTVIPRDTLTGEEQHLAHLKDRPLGSVLFKEPTMKRSIFEFLCLPAGSQWHAEIAQIAKRVLPDLWARRSLFSLHGKSLLLTEVFLPDIATI